MVNCWFGARWFGFLGFFYERDCCLRASDSNPKPPGINHRGPKNGGGKLGPSPEVPAATASAVPNPSPSRGVLRCLGPVRRNKPDGSRRGAFSASGGWNGSPPENVPQLLHQAPLKCLINSPVQWILDTPKMMENWKKGGPPVFILMVMFGILLGCNVHTPEV